MSVTLILRKQKFEVEAGQTIQQALRQIGLQPESYLALREGELLTENEPLHEGDTIKLVAVISGGARAR